MSSCELCGAEKVTVRSVRMGRAEVSACNRCRDSMGLTEKEVAPGLQRARNMRSNSAPQKSSRKKNIMSRGKKELADDWTSRVITARESKGWSKKELASKLAETINVISSLENGKPPTDAVIRKLERMLDIELMVDATPREEQRLGGGPGRGLTLGDYLLGGDR